MVSGALQSSRRQMASCPAPSSRSPRAASSPICKPSDFRIAPRRFRMKTDSIFWIASMSKPVTSVAAMILVGDGKLDLDAPVAQYLPELRDMQVAVEEARSDRWQDGIRARSSETPDDDSRSAAPYLGPHLSGTRFCGRTLRLRDSGDRHAKRLEGRIQTRQNASGFRFQSGQLAAGPSAGRGL